eukprot:3755973-Amphidinium_carterae.1
MPAYCPDASVHQCSVSSDDLESLDVKTRDIRSLSTETQSLAPRTGLQLGLLRGYASTVQSHLIPHLDKMLFEFWLLTHLAFGNIGIA